MNSPHFAFDAFGVILATLLGFLLGSRLGRSGATLQGRLRGRALAALLAGPFLALCAAAYFRVLMRSAWVEWHTPLLLDYYAVPGLWMLVLSALTWSMATAMGIAFHERHRGRWLLVALLPALAIPIAIAGHSVPRFEPVGLREPRISDDGIILQSSGSTCAPAVCANLAQFHGHPTTEAGMAALLGTARTGTRTAQIVHGMRKLGIHLRKRNVSLEELGQIRLPAIAFTGSRLNPDSHTVLIMASEGDAFEVWDPLHGKSVHTSEQLAPLWSGHVLEMASL
jgi:hypothetical protein